MARCQRCELLTLIIEERVRADNERVGMQTGDSGKGPVQFGLGTSLYSVELHAFCVGGLLRVFDLLFPVWKVRVHQQGDHPGL